MNAQCGFKSIAKRHPMDTTRHRTICQCWAFGNGHLIITFIVSYAQLFKENVMNGVFKKHTRIVNKILLTYKLDPQRGSSSLLWSTKANMPASWTRGGNYRWDETSGFFGKLLLNTSRFRHVFTRCSVYICTIFPFLILLSLCLPPSPGPTGGDTPLVSVVSCPALILAMPSRPSKLAEYRDLIENMSPLSLIDL